MNGLERVQILGTGGWGTAVAILLAKQDRPVSLWGRSPEFLQEMQESGENEKYLPGVPIPEALHFQMRISMWKPFRRNIYERSFRGFLSEEPR